MTVMSKWLRQLLSQMKTLAVSVREANVNRTILITVSITAIGLTWFAYYFQVVYNKNKRIMSKARRLVEMIPELKNAHVKIKNPDRVEFLLSNMINMGKEKLQVVSDFDRTLSLVTSPTSNALLEMSQFASTDMKRQFQKLRDQYLPIEHNPNISKEEKIPSMVEWWTKSLGLTVETQITRDAVKDMVTKNANTQLKEGCKWFFYTLERNDVPLLVFSAGLGDIIQEWIHKEAGTFKNMKVVSNFMQFDSKTSRIVGFGGKLIHVFNKNEGALLDTVYEKSVKSRPNVILIGDSLGDVDMANGLLSTENVLKIGFLNEKIDQLLPAYMNAYDIVTIKDNTFEIPNAILKNIL